jgi:phosphoribosylformylglycinamidine synthase subunit PurS
VKFGFGILIRLKEGFLDPQGKTVEDAMPAMGWVNVSAVRIGKHIQLIVDADDEEAAVRQVKEMAERFLCNPVIEEYRVLEGQRAPEEAPMDSQR